MSFEITFRTPSASDDTSTDDLPAQLIRINNDDGQDVTPHFRGWLKSNDMTIDSLTDLQQAVVGYTQYNESES